GGAQTRIRALKELHALRHDIALVDADPVFEPPVRRHTFARQRIESDACLPPIIACKRGNGSVSYATAGMRHGRASTQSRPPASTARCLFMPLTGHTRRAPTKRRLRPTSRLSWQRTRLWSAIGPRQLLRAFDEEPRHRTER